MKRLGRYMLFSGAAMMVSGVVGFFSESLCFGSPGMTLLYGFLTCVAGYFAFQAAR